MTSVDKNGARPSQTVERGELLSRSGGGTLPGVVQRAGMRRLVQAVQELSLARSLEGVAGVVRTAARELTGADGATFVLREGTQCHYLDEDAIGPLWKGRRFPLTSCISGWVMQHRKPAVIEDIYVDPRIPKDAYRPTFVKSLVMVPIRAHEPIGAIGNYWARPHRASLNEVELLQSLAHTTSVALENVRVYAELEQRVKDRTVELEAANRELQAFSYSVSHDLQGPARRIASFVALLREQCRGKIEPEAIGFLDSIQQQTSRIKEIIADLLQLSQIARADLRYGKVNLSKVAGEIACSLQETAPERTCEFRIQDGVEVDGDAGLMRLVLENLLGNAWKYSSRREAAVIEFGSGNQAEGIESYVRDNGAGFDPQFAGKLFTPFQRLHSDREFPGTGIGLAIVQRAVQRHGGEVRAESAPDRGATFFFCLPRRVAAEHQ